MNKKIFSLLFLLILLISATLSYAFFIQPALQDSHQTDSDSIDLETFKSDIDSLFLEEDEELDIGEMS